MPTDRTRGGSIPSEPTIGESKPSRGQGLPAKQFVQIIGCGSGPLLSAMVMWRNWLAHLTDIQEVECSIHSITTLEVCDNW